MADRHRASADALRAAVLDSDGHTDRTLRAAAAGDGELPEALRAYVDKIHRHAYTVTDEDIAALRAAGYTEDQIFEVTAAAAVGAGMTRLEAGLAAIAGTPAVTRGPG
jgi:alkylhydroperoxidase family enzyme